VDDPRCPFCHPDPSRIVARSELAYALRDGFPVNPGHTLIIPWRHVPTWTDATAAERADILALADQVQQELESSEPRPDGFNLGVNIGRAAGQTVMHLHLHVIPRFDGDVDDPAGGVRFVIPERGNYRNRGHIPRVPDRGREPALVTGGATDPFLTHLRPLMAGASSIDILAAFVQQSGVVEVRPLLRSALLRGASVRILTGDYLHITQSQALRSLLDLEREACIPESEEDGGRPGGTLSVRVVELASLRDFARSFHPKAWVVRGLSGGVGFVGSSNLSRPALRDGLEWNLRLEQARDPVAFSELCDRWDALWTRGRDIDEPWLDAYTDRSRLESVPLPPYDLDAGSADIGLPPLRDVQEEALEALAKAREEGRSRALVVMATGLGKTRVAVEDALRFASGSRPLPRVLLLAHRKELLTQAGDAFEAALPGVKLSWFVGPYADASGEVVLGSVQKVHLNLADLEPETFAYVIVDEVHHAHAPTYRAILAHLRPRFLLGLTATPERADAGDILGLFDDNVAHTADIGEGIARRHLVPFRYFGLRDTVDYQEQVPWRSGRFDPVELERAVQTQERMCAVWDACQEHAGTRTLVFCCSVAHADFVKRWLGGQGMQTLSVHTGPDSDDRAQALDLLERGEVQAVCAVDLYNEGVDVPRVDRVLMLRPTESPLLFLQQLGRGLRRPMDGSKDSLTVLDFVGNHRVFLDRVRTLLNLAGSGRKARSVHDLIRAGGSVELPGGSSVELELEAVDLLRKLLPSGAGHVLGRVYRELRDARGQRPRLGELFRMGQNPASLKAHPGWFDFVESEGDLSEDERSVHTQVGAFLRALERREAMSKSYKMVTLQALIEAGALSTGMPVPELAERAHRILVRSPELFRDIEGVRELGDPRAPESRVWERYWRKNPIHFWTQGGRKNTRRWFRLDGDRFVPAFGVEASLLPTLEAMVAEVVDYRLARYRRSRREDEESVPSAFVCRVIHNKRAPIIKLPDRARFPRIPEAGTTVDVKISDGTYWRFRFQKIACNVARPLDSHRNQLPDLMRRWFGPDAGRPGTDYRVRFSPAPEGWWIEPLPVEGAEVVPFPTLGRVVAFPSLRAAAGWGGADASVDSGEGEEVALPVEAKDDMFAIRASGSSMHGWRSEIRDGDWLLMQYCRSLGIGALTSRVALISRGDPREGVDYYLKRVVDTGKGLVLHSDNPDVEDRPVQQGDEPIAQLVKRIRPEDLAPEQGAVLADGELARAFRIGEAPIGTISRVDGHLFVMIEGRGALAGPDRLELTVRDRRPGETAFVLGRVEDGSWKYLGVGRWLEDEDAWGIPEVDFATWRALGKGRSASRRLDARWLDAAAAAVASILERVQPEQVVEHDGRRFLLVGRATRGGLRVASPDGAFGERTVSLTDLAWALAAMEEAKQSRQVLNEALVNRLRYLDGTPKGSTRWIDTGWAIVILGWASVR
jgi:superfamily II DNA or RNA helicase/diadenosine tetraphosphate (Ap4A) HIT family hydrolase/HKD family nuclease/SOS-response transcriptional repressor LexA